MLRFRSLGSGSTGNATLIEAIDLVPTRVLVDCGLGIRQLAQRLASCGLALEHIDAVFITHEHGDHIGCAHILSQRCKIPVWMSRGTYRAIGEPDFSGMLHIARDGAAIDVGGLQLTPFTVPHDAREPLQLTCTDGATKLGLLTDLGHATSHVLAHIQACDALFLECNHDLDMLARSPYPDFLKQRVSGDYGHLSNLAAADIVRAVLHPGLRHVVAAHLSAQNNQPALVRAMISQVIGCAAEDITIASAADGTGWLHL